MNKRIDMLITNG